MQTIHRAGGGPARPAQGGTRRARRLARAAGFVLALLALPLLLPGQPATAAELRVASVEPAGAAPAPAYPVPSDPGTIFYLQRSSNPNTVVYAARFGADGNLDAKEPLAAFWRRFNSDGDRKKLSMLERRFAYGVTASPRAGGGFDVRFKAIPDLAIVLEQRAPGQAVLTVTAQGQPVELTYGYLEVDEGGLTPSVTGLRLFGRRPDGQPVEITYNVSGGQIAG